MQQDPEEQWNRLTDRPAVAKALRKRLESFFDRHADPKYDMFHGGTSQAVVFHPIEPKREAPPSAEPPAAPQGYVPAKLQVPDGFRVQLAAAPPLVQHPMMATFDDRGRLFVAESAGLNLRNDALEEQLPNSVLLLEDTDQDGRFDKRTVFADKMTLPMGAAWHDGSLYVASPPNIWRLQDTDDDGVADVREALVSGFGYNGNAASIHGCFVSPNGRIYWCDGRHGHTFKDGDGNVTSQKAGSYIFSCRPDGGDVRAHCGGGMDNPVEVDFTQTGDVFGTVNILKASPREDCLVHWLFGGTYPHSQRVLGEFKRTGPLLEPVLSFGHVAVSGQMRYRSGVLDREFANDIFVTIFNTGEVVRCSWEEEGSTFRSQMHPFLKALSPDFHPTDVVEDADGGLLVVDTGGWFRIGCPTSQIAKPEVAGGIYRITREGVTNAPDPWGNTLNWDNEPSANLVRRLYDPRFKVRERAIAACANVGEEAVNALKGTIDRQPYPDGRLNALWALSRIDSPRSQAVVRDALSNRYSAMRKVACQILADRPDAEALPGLLQCLQDDSPHIRRVAAKAIGQLRNAKAVPELLKSLEFCVDRAGEHAIIYALLQIDAAAETQAGLASSVAAIRRGALIALDQMESGSISVDSIAASLSDDDATVREVALQIMQSNPRFGELVLPTLKAWSSRERDITQLAAAFMTDPTVAQWGAQQLASATASPNLKRQLLEAIGLSEPVKSEPLASALIQSLELADKEDLSVAIRAAGNVDDSRLAAALLKLSQDESLARSSRLQAIAAMTRTRRTLDENAFALLRDTLQDETAGADVGQAVSVLSRSSLTAPQLISLSKQMRRLGSMALGELLVAYTRDRTPDVGFALVEGLNKADNAPLLSESQLTVAIGGHIPEVRSKAEPLLTRIRERVEATTRLMARWKQKLSDGDAVAGREIFYGKQAQCANCHQAEASPPKDWLTTHTSEGFTPIGPDLRGIGKIRSEHDLLEAILFPSASFAREYEPYTVLTQSGQLINGLLLQSSSADSVAIQPATGKPMEIPKSEIEIMKPGTVSIMPQGLHETLTDQQMADLIAFLRSRK
ncbi:MAG: HEAT repeat domain-containing protein [Pirellulaceae bacterium]